MLKISELYCSYYIKQNYTNIDEAKILTRLYEVIKGTVEKNISKIINQAVLDHMTLDISSTIMQMLELNNYLSQLFIRNFKALIYNYCLHYLQQKGINEISEEEEEKIREISKTITMKTELADLTCLLDKIKESSE